MKKIISIVLCLVLTAIPLCTTSAAALTAPEYPFVLVRGMDFNGLFIDEGTENERPAIGPFESQDILQTLLYAGVAAGVGTSMDNAVNELIVYAKRVLGNLACDNTGASIYNVDPHRYPEAMSTYSDFPYSDVSEIGMIKRAVELYGGENVYYFCYDWRMNPLDVADEIAATVDKAIAETGKSKVNLINCSMGGVMTVAYMTKYGYDKLNKCVFCSSTAGGIGIISDLFLGKVCVDSQALYNYVKVNLSENPEADTLFTLMNILGVFDVVSDWANAFIGKHKEKVYDELLVDLFGNMLSLWALVKQDKFDDCVAYMFGDDEEGEHAEFLTKARQLQDMMAARDQLLDDAYADGVEIIFFTSYNFPSIPIYENSAVNGDGVIETHYMSKGATVADYGTTLDESTIDINSPYVSADLIIDASTCQFPDTTWFIKNAPHVGCDYGTGESDFLFWLFDTENPKITDNPAYPQFMVADSNLSLTPLT